MTRSDSDQIPRKCDSAFASPRICQKSTNLTPINPSCHDLWNVMY